MTTTLKDTTAKDLSNLFNDNSLAEALFWAATNGQTETVRFLLDRGIDPDARYIDDQYTCESALSRATNPDVVRLLVERGAKDGLPEALSEAASDGCTDTVLFLLDRVGDTFSKEDLETALSSALFEGASRKQRSPDAALLLDWQLEHNEENAAPAAPSPGPTAPAP